MDASVTILQNYIGEVTITDTATGNAAGTSMTFFKSIPINPAGSGKIYILKTLQITAINVGYRCGVDFRKNGYAIMSAPMADGNISAHSYSPLPLSTIGPWNGTLTSINEINTFYPGNTLDVYRSGLDTGFAFTYSMTAVFRVYSAGTNG